MFSARLSNTRDAHSMWLNVGPASSPLAQHVSNVIYWLTHPFNTLCSNHDFEEEEEEEDTFICIRKKHRQVQKFRIKKC